LGASGPDPNKDAAAHKRTKHTGIDRNHKPSADPQGKRYLGLDTQFVRPVDRFSPGQAAA